MGIVLIIAVVAMAGQANLARVIRAITHASARRPAPAEPEAS